MFHVSIDNCLSSSVCASFKTFNLKHCKCAPQFNDHKMSTMTLGMTNRV